MSKVCPVCKGEGCVERPRYSLRSYRRRTMGLVTCPQCGGIGRIEKPEDETSPRQSKLNSEPPPF